MSISPQRANERVVSSYVGGSAASKATSVSSENTTPNPNVSSAALRSHTVTSCPRRLNRIAQYRPPGPPPRIAICIRSADPSVPVRALIARNGTPFSQPGGGSCLTVAAGNLPRIGQGRAVSGPEADHPLLQHGRQVDAVAAEEPAARQTTPALRGLGLLGVQDPVVGPARAVEPHRVVEARGHQPGDLPGETVTAQDRLEDRVVARVGKRDPVQRRLVAQRRERSQPQRL